MSVTRQGRDRVRRVTQADGDVESDTTQPCCLHLCPRAAALVACAVHAGTVTVILQRAVSTPLATDTEQENGIC